MPVLTISTASLADYDFNSDSTELINFSEPKRSTWMCGVI